MKMESLYEFIILAHYLNFTTAASYLHMSQPSLSKHISELEQEVGFELLKRGKKMQLTAAGMAFLEDSIQLHHEYKSTLERCRTLAAQITEDLFIQEPYLLDATGEIILKAVKNMKASNPLLNLQLISDKGKKSLESLDEGAINIAFTVDIGTRSKLEKVGDKKSLSFFPLIEEPLYVWLHRSSSLTRLGTVSLDDLVGITINMIASRRFDPMRFALIELFKSIGKRAILQSYPVNTLDEFFIYTQDRNSVFIVTESVTRLPLLQMQSDMSFMLIDDPRATLTSYIVTKSESEKQSIDIFLKTIASVIDYDIAKSDQSIYLPNGDA